MQSLSARALRCIREKPRNRFNHQLTYKRSDQGSRNRVIGRVVNLLFSILAQKSLTLVPPLKGRNGEGRRTKKVVTRVTGVEGKRVVFVEAGWRSIEA